MLLAELGHPCNAWAKLPCGMEDLSSRPGIEPMCPVLQGGFLATGPPVSDSTQPKANPASLGPHPHRKCPNQSPNSERCFLISLSPLSLPVVCVFPHCGNNNKLSLFNYKCTLATLNTWRKGLDSSSGPFPGSPQGSGDVSSLLHSGLFFSCRYHKEAGFHGG